MDVASLLHELTPEAERLLARHDATSKPWYPHALVPWGRGRDFDEDYEWSAAEAGLPDALRSALFVNLLTEDNLPYSFRDVQRMFGRDGVWGEWGRRWTAEEGRHAIVIRDYLTVTRALDPVELENARIAQVSGGQVPEPPTALDGFAYLTLQELATRIAHRQTAKLIDDEAGYRVMARVGADENYHFLYYRDLAQAALRIDPSAMMIAIDEQVRGFSMPGTGIPNFAQHSRAIANAGIYNLTIHHDQILAPIVLRYWDIGHLESLTPEAEQAREACVAWIARIEKVGR